MFVETSTLWLLLPEIILVLMAAWMFVAGTFAEGRTFWSTFALLSYLVAGLALYNVGQQYDPAVLRGPSGPFAIDGLGNLMRWLALVTGIASTLMTTHLLRKQAACELLGLIMLAVAGVMIASQATDLVMLFLGLELISIPTYVLLFIGRPGREGAESTAKYFYLSVLSSAMLLYGFSFLYGMTGTTTMFGNDVVPGIRDQLLQGLAEQDPLMSLAPVALVLIFAGLGFKMAAVPFHFYAPDVYEGTTNVNAGLLAVLPKIGGAVALVRLIVIALPPQFAEFAWQFALVIAVLTMTIGNVCALWQNNLRRMMGYSSIAHAGYMLIGLTAALAVQSLAGQDTQLSYGGVAAMLFYLIVYAFGSLGTFAVLAHLSTESREFNTVDELAGLNKAHPTAAALMAVFMFSLAGIPPLAGFWGKLTLFTSAVNLSTKTENSQLSTWLMVLAVAGALNAAIAATYYLRVVGAMYFRPATGTPVERGGVGGLGAAAICCVMIVLLGVAPRFMLASARQAENSALAWPLATAPQLADQTTAPVAPLANR